MIDMMFQMLQALINARIVILGEKARTIKTFHEDIIEELKMLKAVVGSTLKGEE